MLNLKPCEGVIKGFLQVLRKCPLFSDVLPGTVAAAHLLLPGRLLLGVVMSEQTKIQIPYHARKDV